MRARQCVKWRACREVREEGERVTPRESLLESKHLIERANGKGNGKGRRREKVD